MGTCHRAESGPSGIEPALVVAYDLRDPEARAALDALECGYRDLTLVWLDPRHTIAVLKPGGATRLAS